MKTFQFYAQVSTSHSSLDSLTPKVLRERLDAVQAILPISGLIVGSLENPAVFNELTVNRRPDDPETFLWYNLLSDYPGQDEAESVITRSGKSCKKWFGWGEDAQDEVSESFLFSCPNNPAAKQKTLKGLSDLIDKYPFNGVFLDKFRYPSPASGLDLTLSCFCPHCRAKAAAQGLDLDAVKAELDSLKGADMGTARGSDWLNALVEKKPLLREFLKFREQSVLELTREVRALVQRKGMKLGFDLFSPAFAELVGYDFGALKELADWIKPMTYQYALGPAGLRLETVSLIDGIKEEFGTTEEAIFAQCEKSLPMFTQEGYRQLKEQEVPMAWVRSEMKAATDSLAGTPVYMGLECVSFPGVIDVQPEQAAALLRAALENGADGTVLSWDLMHMPPENLRAMRDVYEEFK